MRQPYPPQSSSISVSRGQAISTPRLDLAPISLHSRRLFRAGNLDLGEEEEVA